MQLPSYSLDTPFQVKLSFHQVIEALEKKALDSASEQAVWAQNLLQEVLLIPALRDGITDSSILEENEELIGRLLTDYFPPALSLNEIKAVSIPYRDFMFNLSQRFKNILQSAGPDFEFTIRDFNAHQFYVFSCCLVLREFYDVPIDFGKPLFFDIPTANGITKHYRILYNADFLDILPTEHSVVLTPDDIDLLMNNFDDLALWKEKFPEESWVLKGFAIMTLFDATVENAVSLLKEKLLGLNTIAFQQSIESIFQSIYRIPDIRVGFTLFIEEENKFKTARFGQAMKSFILSDEAPMLDKAALCPNSYKSLIEEREYFAISDNDKYFMSNPESPLARNLQTKNIHSFILAPVVKNGILLGVLEVVSPRPKELNSVNANNLAVVMPFLVNSIERLVNEFQNQVQAVIQQNYTTIHSSVHWKFRLEAEKFIESSNSANEYVLPEIIFDNVYPLYGQADIKGSSDVRNSSVQNDLKNQLQVLLSILHQLGSSSLEKEAVQVQEFLDQLNINIQANTEQYISNYLDSGIHQHLAKITAPEWMPVINTYFTETDKLTGSFYTNRRKYEKTISMINEKMAHIIDKRQIEAQNQFPHYYERFKTDGIEHNLYIGDSIAPAKKFDIKHLHMLRLWQMQVLCEIEIAHYRLKPALPYPLDVTTLILVYHTPISIRFRMDEKRFDVDGTYNARFEIVKKRIDKANVKNTHERITESGKMTIVYSSDAEEEEYRAYIDKLQSQRLLENNVEKLDVEDLQGVSGLKALRVKIAFPIKLS